MQDLQIPASIWLNLGVLVAAAGFVWFRLAREGRRKENRKKVRPKDRARPGADAGRPARADR